MDSPCAPRPDALVGNDDLGQMSAWYLFTALGFYPVTPASDEYALGRPFVAKAAIHLGNGHTFTVSATPLDDAHPFVGAGILNGKPLDRTYLHHAEILASGERRFSMQAEPNRDWGKGDTANAPRRQLHRRPAETCQNDLNLSTSGWPMLQAI